MAYSIVIAPAAKRDLKRLPKDALRRVGTAITSLANDPHPAGSTKLSGTDFYRVRVGDYRVIYRVQEQQVVVLVLRVGHRRDIYRNLP